MNIVNPEIVNNIAPVNLFNLREIEYKNILNTLSQIIIPAQEEGFEVTDFGMVPSITKRGELRKSLTNKIILKFQKNDKEIDLSTKIPKLIKKNYIVINGQQKIPLIQLYDIPVVERGKTIKLRTNASSITILKGEYPPFIKINFQGKLVPLAYLIVAYYGIERTKEILQEPYEENEFSKNWYGLLVTDLKRLLSEEGLTHKDIVKFLGWKYSKYNPIKRAREVIFGMEILLKVDIFTRSFFKSDCMMDEIINLMRSKKFDDNDFRNKRLRCWEYILFNYYIKAIYDLCVTNKYSKKIHFKISMSQILTNVNVSDIVQFDFSINPIEELTKMSRTSIIGPGGFSRTGIPVHLRDIHPSLFGRLCPVDTPDRDNCGVLQNLLPCTRLDNNLRLSEETESKYITSIPVMMVPFLEHNDQTRLQMSSSQMRQAIMLKDFDPPMIKSGCENLFSEHTQFCTKAEYDGKVKYLDNEHMIVQYNSDEKKGDIFYIGTKRIYVDNLDVYTTYFKKDEEFKKGDILYESNFVKDGSIQFGRNLFVGFMNYYGSNYEDGIVISDRLVKENILTSKHIFNLSFMVPANKVLQTLKENEYKPLPEIGETILAGHPYARLKAFPASVQDDYLTVFKETNILSYPTDIKIIKINLYINNSYKMIPEFEDWIKKYRESQKQKLESLKVAIKDTFNSNDAKEIIKDNNFHIFDATPNSGYKTRKEVFSGILVELECVFERPIEIGDKIGNRHGNKGVIVKIIPENEMPQTEDGKHLDVCLGPLGVPSRMNIGQLYELYLTKVLHHFKETTKKDIENKVKNEIIKEKVQHFIKLIDKTKSNWYFSQFIEQMPDIITKEFIDDLCLIQPPFESISVNDALELRRYTGVSDTDRVFEPSHKVYINEKIATGYMYMFKMTHMAEKKLTARSIGPYSRKLLQPLSGKKNKGGQRLGEMEQGAIISHDAKNLLYESFTVKSDSIKSKNQFIQEILQKDNVVLDELDHSLPESVKLLDKYCKVIGIDID